MAITVACTAYYGSNAGKGWSETQHLSVPGPVVDLPGILVSFRALLENKRRPLLGKDRYLKGIKISYKTASGGIASIPYRYQPYLYPQNQRAGCAPSVSAELRMGEQTGEQFSNIYLRGFWDDVEENEQLNFNTAVGGAWKDLHDAYVAALIAGGYGWPAQDEIYTSRGEITNYVANVDGTITFTQNQTFGPPPGPAGTILPIRFARINEGSSPLNTSFIVVRMSATTVKTVKKTAAGPFTNAGTYVEPVQTFARYSGVLYTILSKKGEGRPTLQSPARRKARARF